MVSLLRLCLTTEEHTAEAAGPYAACALIIYAARIIPLESLGYLLTRLRTVHEDRIKKESH